MLRSITTDAAARIAELESQLAETREMYESAEAELKEAQAELESERETCAQEHASAEDLEALRDTLRDIETTMEEMHRRITYARAPGATPLSKSLNVTRSELFEWLDDTLRDLRNNASY